MSPRVRRDAGVESDILEIAKWIARHSRESAIRFLVAVEDTLGDLRQMPQRGGLKGWRGKKYSGVRTWAVRGFPNHLIVYEVRSRDVYVFAVVHGSRAYQKLIRERME